MSWEDIIKIDARELVDDIAKLKEIVAEMEETIRLYNDGQMLDEASIRLDIQEFKLLAEKIGKNMVLLWQRINLLLKQRIQPEDRLQVLTIN